jgi:hypothetical protein
MAEAPHFAVIFDMEQAIVEGALARLAALARDGR